MEIEFEIETEIARPREEVFAFVTDPARLPLWDRRVVAAEVLGGGPVRFGSRIREVRAAGPKRLAQTVLVSAYEPPARFGLRVVDGRFPVHGDLSFEAAGDERTVVRLRAHGSVPGPRPLAPAVRALARREMRSQHRRLKAVLEGRGGERARAAAAAA
jgi:uncharacterized protein YndB with AHSA1/START domain